MKYVFVRSNRKSNNSATSSSSLPLSIATIKTSKVKSQIQRWIVWNVSRLKWNFNFLVGFDRSFPIDGIFDAGIGMAYSQVICGRCPTFFKNPVGKRWGRRMCRRWSFTCQPKRGFVWSKTRHFVPVRRRRDETESQVKLQNLSIGWRRRSFELKF